MTSDRDTDTLMIRTALPAEVDAIADLHLRARSTYYPDGLPPSDFDWRAAWLASVERPDGHVLCAVEDGRIVAIASFRTAEGDPVDTVTLFQFHVDPDRWRSGLGTALHRACVEQWRADARRTAVLDVHVDNERAQAFYVRQGWVADPDDGGHHLGMRLDLGRE
ncbi:GNAT family N-acetyltransferase [Streptomyces sp. MBT53]|uniref:GNAT family N-acetyltransferase n=1 Tax=Streptomyces sp. MBT53 TaxID=1488384 RepID=UPI00191126C1|nr:GNAT family N-acetyltransferase [Streptomyces sp. MBT53]MBK6012773.1 GNAT family N-acetyltransferase [Streptomyces sp. MBT53]